VEVVVEARRAEDVESVVCDVSVLAAGGWHTEAERGRVVGGVLGLSAIASKGEEANRLCSGAC